MLFQTPDYLYVFERALKNHAAAASDLTALAKAYENLEKYFLQLVEQPWKREFKRIKVMWNLNHWQGLEVGSLHT